MNWRRVMAARTLIGSVLLGTAALAGPVSAKDTAVWLSYVDDEAAAINFSTPESDDVRFVLYCEHATRNVSVSVHSTLKGIKANQALTIELSAGGTKVSLNGAGVADRNDGFIYGEAKEIAVAPVLAVMRAPGTLTAKVAGKSFSYPEKNRAKNLKTFESACKAK